MNLIYGFGETVSGAGLLAQASPDGVSISGVLTLLIVFGALIALVGLLTMWRKKQASSSAPAPAPADPLAEARVDEPAPVNPDRVDPEPRR